MFNIGAVALIYARRCIDQWVDYGADYMRNHPILSTSDFMAVYQVYVDEIMFESASYVAYMPMCGSCDR